MLAFMSKRLLATAFAAAIAMSIPLGEGRAQQPTPPLVMAAASMKNALDAIAADWRQSTGKTVVISYGASPALARQVEQGAPADMFISADLDWMDWLQQRNLIKVDTRLSLLGNTLVLIAPADSTADMRIAPGLDLGAALGDSRLAICEVKTVPAGKYGKAALEKLGMWAGVENKLAQADTVRAALALVARGEAKFGIVYGTDARVEPKVKVVDTFPTASHAPIVYPVALTATSTNPDAASFLAYLKSGAAARRFVEQGFTVLAD